MSWAISSRRFAKKVKLATSGCSSAEQVVYEDEEEEEEPAEKCDACGQVKIDVGGTATQEWQGLPAGVKFDPNDKEILDHLAAKLGKSGAKPHVLLDEFIPTLEGDDGICYTHPEKLPGVKNDGRSSHFFHRPANAYTKGTRKRRKVHTGDEEAGGETRWHKTGKTRAVQENGEPIGWKKIMVLYTNFRRKAKPKKTNWVMHQYHLGHNEDEREGEMVVSKVFYQTQPRSSSSRKATESDEEDVEIIQQPEPSVSDEPPPAPVVAHAPPVVSHAAPVVSHAAPVVSHAPEVLRPCPTREPRLPLHLAERLATPVQSDVSLSVRTPESSLTVVKCAPSVMTPCVMNGVSTDARERAAEIAFEDLLCDEDIADGLICPDLNFDCSQDVLTVAAGLGLTLEDDNGLANPDLDLAFLENLESMPDISSQELRDWFRTKSASQEVWDSQSGT